MFEIPWQQLSGAVAGGLVGSFCGFVANNLQQRTILRRARRNVASALSGELEALRSSLQRLPTTEEEATSDVFYRHFRAERDYSPIFRSLGSSIGLLDSPLPRDLAHWYTGLLIVLERAREMYGLAGFVDDQAREDWHRLAHVQRADVADLIRQADELIARLSVL